MRTTPLVLSLALALAPLSHSLDSWDYDAMVKVELRDWRYSALSDKADKPPTTPFETLAIITLPWTVERTRPQAWFTSSIKIPAAWQGQDIILHAEGVGPMSVFAAGANLASLDSAGVANITAPLPAGLNGGDTIPIAIACTHGERPAQLTNVWLEAEPAGLTQAVARANTALNNHKDYGTPINPWKRMVEGPDAEAFKVDFDDSAWDSVNVGDEWRGDYVPAWYRGRVTVPDAIASVPVVNESPLLALDFDDPAACYINGKEVESVEKDFRGSLFALPEGAKPGDTFDVAFRILNRWGGGKLRQASWRLASVDEGLHLKRDLQVELNRLAVTIRAHDKPMDAWVTQVDLLAQLLEPAQQNMITFTDKIREAREAFDTLLDSVAEDPVFLVPPYLQDVRPTEITICFETSAPVRADVTYGTEELNHAMPEETAADTIHKVVLSGLDPNTTYHYQVTAGRQTAPIRTFKTAPDTATTPFNFLVFGDNQSGHKMFDRVSRQMAATDADFVVSVGDVVDRGINWDEWTYQYLLPGRHFMDEKPTYIAMGNHEYGGYDGNPNVAAFDYYFKHPQTSPGSNQYYYSFDYANAHFVIIEPLKMKWMDHENPELGNTVVPDDPELVWIEQDLRENQGKHDWTFVFYHEPAYAETWSGGYYDGEDFIRNAVVPILEKYDVDMVFNGHTHAYERGLPHPKWDPVTRLGNGITYIITGGGGGSLDNHKYKEWDKIDIPDHPANPGSDAPDEGAFYRHHFCDVKVEGKTLTFKAQEVLENGRLGQVLDEFKLQK